MSDSARSKASAYHLETLPNSTGSSTNVTKEDKRLWKEIKQNLRITLFCLGLMSTALLTGYDTVVVGTITALPYFQDFGEKFGDSYIVPSLWLALWSAVAPIGQMAGAVLGGWIQDRLGRRKSIMIGSCFAVASIAVCYVSDKPDDIDARRGVLLVGKTVLGFALGIMLATTQTYMSEVTPAAIRGPILGLIPTGILLGQLTGAIVIWSQSSNKSANSYLISIASQWPFSAAPFFVALVLPESPTWFIRKGRAELALRSLRKLYSGEEAAQKAMDQLVLSIEAESTAQEGDDVTYGECFKGTNRRRTGIVIFASLIPIIFGLPLLGQASYFIQIVGMAAELSLVVLILGIALGFIGNAIGLWVMSKIGRRTLIITSLSISIVLWLGMGIAGIWSGTFTTWYTAATLMCVVVVNGVGSWPASYAVGGEVSSLRLRARSQGIGWFTSSLGNGAINIVLPYIFNPDAGNLGAKLGFVISAFCCVGLAISWLMVPEMRGRSNTDIDRMFEIQLATRKFKGWVLDTDNEHPH